ncbi:MAG: formate--phosphoribosylaminoimidazolecarboxamide ligase [Candidatus Woesebacteria bacterium]
MKKGKASDWTIATLGSHSSLQILKGAKDEGFKTLIVTTTDRESFYRRFPFIDQFKVIPKFSDFGLIEAELASNKVIMIPHGSFVAYLGEERNRNSTVPYFGNKKVLDWEGDRKMQMQWLQDAKINVPKMFTKKDKIDRAVIVKSYGAAGGAGYFVAQNQADFEKKLAHYSSRKYLVQEYVIGVPMYFHYFYSPLTKQIELLSIDRRYETNVDSLGRLPLAHQESIPIVPSFVVVGNSPLVVRESLLPEVYAMAERLVASSQRLIDSRGLFGPFCLETIVTAEQKFYAVEVSCRIVAGTNLFIDSSPYASLLYDEPMSTGRRIAREIKLAKASDRLSELLD